MATSSASRTSSTQTTQHLRDILESKHPPAQPAHPDDIIHSDIPPSVHPIVFDSLDAATIRSAALHTNGAAGPSGLDAHCWRRLCSSFSGASNELCHSLAKVAFRMCTSFVDPSCISPFLAYRLIAINKNPGVRPIGVCQTARRIIAKAALSIFRCDVLEAAGSRQLCAGQLSGTEAAVHAVRSAFQNDETEAVLLVDARNAFNALNRQTALHNIMRICPSLATILINSYRCPTELFVDGNTIWSREGTTQGDPLAMPMFALATIPLILKLRTDTRQVWYADDASAVGKLSSLREWWNRLSTLGPSFGYFANPSKTWLITKEHHLSAAKSCFTGTGVNITHEGRPYLGAPIGTLEYMESFVKNKVEQCAYELSLLGKIASTQPHAAYSAFTHGLTSRWSYLIRTIPHISSLLQPLETLIRTEFLPSLTGRAPPGDLERDLFALPARLCGIAISNPTKASDREYSASLLTTEPLRDLIIAQNPIFSFETWDIQSSIKKDIHRQDRLTELSEANALKLRLDENTRRAVDLASESGASSWLTSLPLTEFGFTLHKSAFRDALALRYGWLPSHIPTHCECGAKFTIDHCLLSKR